jgi:hypothetical protein
MYPDSKYPLTGPMISLPTGHPRLQVLPLIFQSSCLSPQALLLPRSLTSVGLQPENQRLLPTAPHLREQQLAMDQEKIAQMKQERMVMSGPNHLDALRAQVAEAQSQAEAAAAAALS